MNQGVHWDTALGHLLVVPAGQRQSGQWLAKANDNYRLKSGSRVKATDARNLPEPVKMLFG
jgi:hypothetical protein